jgi:GT2 family glycosyltransferase
VSASPSGQADNGRAHHESTAYVVIATFDRCEVTRNCLTRLRDIESDQMRVVVADGGSTDGTWEMVRDEFPDVIALRDDKILWWTAATNLGCAWVLAHAGPEDCVITLNDDTSPTAEWLAAIQKTGAAATDALLGSTQVDDDSGLITDAGVVVDWWTARFDFQWRGQDPALLSGLTPPVLPSDVLNGCGMRIPVAALRSLGPFSSRLPQYAADYEFSRRAARAGWRLLVGSTALLPRSANTTGLHADRVRGLRDLARSLTSVRSAHSLRIRFRYARLACPPAALPSYVACDTVRVLGHVLRRDILGAPA